MKKLILLTCLLAPLPAFAQTPPFVPGANAAAGSAPGPRFEEMKAHALEHLQQTTACVQAAQNMEALKACRPKRPPGGPGGEESGGLPAGASNAWTHPQAQIGQ